ncbi:MAG: methyltransferase domain-containing protein [Deltaproteobacteria bacterium]|nr:methyltransferase domain-containing protein [Deltaproteobacteria bacterium]
MNPKNLTEVQKSFTAQARNFENRNMNFSKQEYLDYTVQCMQLGPGDCVLEAAAGTCACGRSVAPFVQSVVCLDATPAMLEVGKEKAAKSGITNMQFIKGHVEEIPFENQHFDIVLTRLAFHHFTNMERPFSEMNRVLKSGGQLVIIDMEAAEEALRDIEDSIETMRDPSHEKNRSQDEFLALYEKHGYIVTKQEATIIPVSLAGWLALTNTPDNVGKEIESLMKAEIQNGNPTGFRPYLQNDEIYFEQRWVLFIGKKCRCKSRTKIPAISGAV